jgi:hypothetical protein
VATSPALEGMGDVYCEDADVARSVFPGHKELNGVLPWAIDLEAAERLWTLSERLTGKRTVVTAGAYRIQRSTLKSLPNRSAEGSV